MVRDDCLSRGVDRTTLVSKAPGTSSQASHRACDHWVSLGFATNSSSAILSTGKVCSISNDKQQARTAGSHHKVVRIGWRHRCAGLQIMQRIYVL